MNTNLLGAAMNPLRSGLNESKHEHKLSDPAVHIKRSGASVFSLIIHVCNDKPGAQYHCEDYMGCKMKSFFYQADLLVICTVSGVF